MAQQFDSLAIYNQNKDTTNKKPYKIFKAIDRHRVNRVKVGIQTSEGSCLVYPYKNSKQNNTILDGLLDVSQSFPQNPNIQWIQFDFLDHTVEIQGYEFRYIPKYEYIQNGLQIGLLGSNDLYFWESIDEFIFYPTSNTMSYSHKITCSANKSYRYIRMIHYLNDEDKLSADPEDVLVFSLFDMDFVGYVN